MCFQEPFYDLPSTDMCGKGLAGDGTRQLSAGGTFFSFTFSFPEENDGTNREQINDRPN